MSSKPFLFIINPNAGKKNAGIRDRIDTFIHQQGAGNVVLTERAGHATEIAKQSLERGFTPVAVGGDGTMNEVARATVGTGQELGLIPAGSGNGLARHFGIPIETEQAFETLKRRDVQLSDTGRINDSLFLMTVGVGFDSMITEEMSKRERRGWTAYIDIILKTWKDREILPVTFEVNGEVFEREVLMFSVSNTTQFGNGFYIAPQADSNDGLLDITIVKPFPYRASPLLALKAKNIVSSESKYIERMRASKIVLKCNMEKIDLDGESCNAKMPATIKVVKDDMRIIC